MTSRSVVGNGRCTRRRSFPVSLALAVVFLWMFVIIETRRVAAGKPVVFDFTDLVHPGFRYGLINTTVLAMGEFGAFFVLPIFLQAGLHLSAIQSGRWLLPAGIMAFVGGGIGGQLSRRFGPKYVITIGLTLEALGIWLYVASFSTSTTFWALLPALMLHGVGIGFATSQLTNVVLSDIPHQKAGSASGAAGMVRQVGTALGIALIGAIFVSQAHTFVRHDLDTARNIPAAVREQVIQGVGNIGGGPPPARPTPRSATRSRRSCPTRSRDAARPAVAFAGAVVTAGALISLLVPNIPPESEMQVAEWIATADETDADTEYEVEEEPNRL